MTQAYFIKPHFSRTVLLEERGKPLKFRSLVMNDQRFPPLNHGPDTIWTYILKK